MLDCGHLEPVPARELTKKPHECFYLPLHCVIKDSSTTKLRVVFDGSAKTAGGPSLNDVLLVGPKLQPDLFDLVIRFRCFPVALSADIKKMYRQIALHTPDKDYHRILWRNNPDQPIQTYRMTRVTYGIASSAYHSIRALIETAKTHHDPVATPAVENYFYVDNYLGGTKTAEDAITLQDNLIGQLQKGCMELRKWSSNLPEVIKRLPREVREVPEAYDLDQKSHHVKTLGIKWNPLDDNFEFSVTKPDTLSLTKREVLSETSKMYDPLGVLAPVLIKMKMLIQRCWLLSADWDDELPHDISHQWQDAMDCLTSLESFRIPRCILRTGESAIELHVFCDASEKAYASAIYAKTPGHCQLLVAKTRVAPVNSISLPRLELCAALLGTRLLLFAPQWSPSI